MAPYDVPFAMEWLAPSDMVHSLILVNCAKKEETKLAQSAKYGRKHADYTIHKKH